MTEMSYLYSNSCPVTHWNKAGSCTTGVITQFELLTLQMTLSSSLPSSLLSPPLSGVRAEVKYSRPNTESLGYQNHSDKYRLDSSGKSYNNQYYKVTDFMLHLFTTDVTVLGVQCETQNNEASRC